MNARVDDLGVSMIDIHKLAGDLVSLCSPFSGCSGLYTRIESREISAAIHIPGGMSGAEINSYIKSESMRILVDCDTRLANLIQNGIDKNYLVQEFASNSVGPEHVGCLRKLKLDTVADLVEARVAGVVGPALV